MFSTKPAKVKNNPLRRIMRERGHSTRSAAEVLGIPYQRLSNLLTAHDEPESLQRRFEALPVRQPAKLRAAKSGRRSAKA